VWHVTERNFPANCRPIFTLSKHDVSGIADGMTIDADGNLWVAIFNGGKIIKVDPRRPETLLATVEMPVKQVLARPPQGCL
jgi:gluconolactonase